MARSLVIGSGIVMWVVVRILVVMATCLLCVLILICVSVVYRGVYLGVCSVCLWSLVSSLGDGAVRVPVVVDVMMRLVSSGSDSVVVLRCR